MLKNITAEAKNYQNIDEVQKALRNVQTQKSRLKKQKNRKDYEKLMTEILKTEQMLKEVKNYFEPPKTFVTNFTEIEIKNLNFDETMKAIKSIQSKKCNTQFDSDRTDYENACQIEQMLLEHKKSVKPVEETVVKKSELQDLINNLENLEDKVSKESLLEKLRQLL